MIKNDYVKNSKREILKDAEFILKDEKEPVSRIKDILGSRHFLSFKKEVEKQIEDIPFPEDWSYSKTEGMLEDIAENYLLDVEMELEAEIKKFPASSAEYNKLSERLGACKNLLSEVSMERNSAEGVNKWEAPVNKLEALDFLGIDEADFDNYEGNSFGDAYDGYS